MATKKNAVNPAAAPGATAPHGTDDLSVLTFEQAYAELVDVVARLEEAGLTLEESLSLHARGRALAAFCTRQLDQAVLRIRQLGANE